MRQPFCFCDGRDLIQRCFRSSFVRELPDARLGAEFQLQAPFAIFDAAEIQRAIGPHAPR